MRSIAELREQIGQVSAAMRGMHESATAARRPFTEDENSRWKELNTQGQELDRELQRAEVLADAERRMQTRGPSGDTYEVGLEQYSLSRALASLVPDMHVDGGREREVGQEFARRSGRKTSNLVVPHAALVKRDVSVGGGGASLFPETHRGDLFVDILRPELIVGRLGATMIPDLIGDVDIPKLTDDGSTYWVTGDGEAITPSDHTFGDVELSPKTIGSINEYTRKTLTLGQQNPAVEALVRQAVIAKIAVGVDAAALVGSGTGSEPTGIANTVGIGNVAMGATPTWAGTLNVIDAVATDNALRGSLGWAVPTTTVTTLRATPRVSGEAVFIMESPTELAGYPALQSNNFTGTPDAIFGNFADLLIGMWGGVEFTANPYADSVYSKGSVLFRGMQTIDITVRHAESFAIGRFADT